MAVAEDLVGEDIARSQEGDPMLESLKRRADGVQAQPGLLPTAADISCGHVLVAIASTLTVVECRQCEALEWEDGRWMMVLRN